MKVWVEALTPKQVLLFSFLQGSLPGEVFLTTRDYDLNVSLAQRLWRRFYVVGRHGGASLAGKLRQSLQRSRRLAEIAESERPDVHVTFVSPDSSRVAFGLGIPVVAATDSPHSDAASRLPLPLARRVVIPEFLRGSFAPYERLTTLVAFRGLFELAHILRGEPREQSVRELGLEPYCYALVRLGEQKAYYYPDKLGALQMPLAAARSILRESELTVVVYPRYPEQRRAAEAALRDWATRVVFLERATDFLSLEFYAALVVTGGGTLATESALLGTPAVCTYPGRLEVLEYLSALGFSVHRGVPRRSELRRLLGLGAKPREWRSVRQRLQSLFEDPIGAIASSVLSVAGS